MEEIENVTKSAQREDGISEKGVTSEHQDSENIAALRAEMEASFRAARERVTQRLKGRYADAVQESRRRARKLVEDTRRRAQALLRGDEHATVLETKEPAQQLSLHDLHTLERLISHVRHSVVRVCFYNLKLLCPSLVDEYDRELKEQIIANIDQLPRVRTELERFFDQILSKQKIGDMFGEARRAALDRLAVLTEKAQTARDRLDEEQARAQFAKDVPPLIDGLMDALLGIQARLDTRKISVSEVVGEAVELCRPAADQAGLTIQVSTQPTPSVFADNTMLLNVFTELITNAMKHSKATELHVAVSSPNDRDGFLEISFTDNGAGMTAEELSTCLTRGASRGGTGEGLPMVVQVIEEEHLGRFEITATPGEGCCCEVRLPVKLNTRQES